jgi:hypothetical protein
MWAKMDSWYVDQVFSLAAECAYTGNHDVALEDCLDLWALAASLQACHSHASVFLILDE